MRRIHPKQIFNQGQGGFTLIELMIVVAVAGILAVIGFPLYRQHTMKSNRAAAEAFMLQVANRQEQYILNARTFAPYDAAAVNPFASLNLAVPDNVKANYQVQMTPNTGSPSNTYYTITATPIGGQERGVGYFILPAARLIGKQRAAAGEIHVIAALPETDIDAGLFGCIHEQHVEARARDGIDDFTGSAPIRREGE